MDSCMVGQCPGGGSDIASFIFSNLVKTIAASQCALTDPNEYPADIGKNQLPEYDFIVVGSGSAGSVIASRLSEEPKWKVLLIEAGEDPPAMSEVPALVFSLQDTPIDWSYKADGEGRLFLGLHKGYSLWPRGKLIGGSSGINFMMYVRGNRRDYDGWCDQGNKEWSYDDVLPYFMKSEDYQADDKQNNWRDFHGEGGHLTVEKFPKNPLKDLMLSAAQELGFPEVDVNAENQIGFTRVPMTIRNGKRCSAAKAFLNPARNRTNLHVMKKSFVTKVLIDPKTKAAKGVRLINDKGETKEVTIKKEVILSAGAIGSPHLLMLSGIGPQKNLETVGISPVIQNSNVGGNLRDHALFLGVVFSINKSKIQPMPPSAVLDIAYDYLIHSSGPFASLGTSDITGFINTKLPPFEQHSSVPNLQFINLYFPVNDSLVLPNYLSSGNIDDNFKNQMLAFNKEHNLLAITPVLLSPKSSGKIELANSDPRQHPKIYPRYFTNKEDMETMLEGIQFLLKLGTTEAFKAMEAELLQFKYKTCPGEKYGTNSYWECGIKEIASTTYHPSGTCKMGPKSDKDAVVDDKLKVHGVEKLRVADSSIMPMIVHGNTNAPTIMIGEKASDMIKQENQ